MSKETDYLKLFKYDKETDDFNTTTFNIQQCLNNNWDKIDVNVKNNATDIGDKSALETINKTNLVGAINELFTNANNGKSLIANVVGNPLLATDTFQQQHDKIQTLKNTFATNLTAKEQNSSGTESLNNLINKVANINVGKRYAEGTFQASRTNSTISIRGLPFTPRVVIISSPEMTGGGGYLTNLGVTSNSQIIGLRLIGSPDDIRTTDTDYGITYHGFDFSTSFDYNSVKTVKWYAWE
ncbi:hypothetical protein AB2Z22_000447 [Clostridium botulinum]